MCTWMEILRLTKLSDEQLAWFRLQSGLARWASDREEVEDCDLMLFALFHFLRELGLRKEDIVVLMVRFDKQLTSLAYTLLTVKRETAVPLTVLNIIDNRYAAMGNLGTRAPVFDFKEKCDVKMCPMPLLSMSIVLPRLLGIVLERRGQPLGSRSPAEGLPAPQAGGSSASEPSDQPPPASVVDR